MKFLILAILLAGCTVHHPRKAVTFKAAYENTVDVGAVRAEEMTQALVQLHSLAEDGAKEVTLRIDSTGGDISLGLRWMRLAEDQKKTHELHVTCIVDGMAYSMAAVILESPVCDQRLATNRSTILFHNGTASADGDVNILQNAQVRLAALNVAMSLVVAERLKLPVEQYRTKIARGDWVLSAPEALAKGVIDGLVSPSDIAPPDEGE